MTRPAPGSTLHDLPAPLPFTRVLTVAAGLFKARLVSLVGGFAVVFAGAFGIGTLIDRSGIVPSNLAIVLYEVIVGIGGAFIVALASLSMADSVTGRPQDAASRRAIVRAQGRELSKAGLLSALLILAITMFGLGPVAVGVLGPPLVVQAIILEYRPFREAVTHVRGSASGQWVRITLVLLATALAAVILQVVLWVLVSRAFLDVDDATVRLAWTLFGYTVHSITAAFLCAAGFALYLDIRARSEDLTNEGFIEERRNATFAPAPADSSQD